MPTCDRLNFVPQAVRYLSSTGLSESGARHRGRRSGNCRAATAAATRGFGLFGCLEKRTSARSAILHAPAAHGEFIIHWDDDDWYPPDRVTQQIEALRASARGDLRDQHTLLPRREGRGGPGGIAIQEAVAPGLPATRSLIAGPAGRRIRFPEIQVGEDSRFVWAEPRAALCDLGDSESVRRAHSCRQYQPQITLGRLLADMRGRANRSSVSVKSGRPSRPRLRRLLFARNCRWFRALCPRSIGGSFLPPCAQGVRFARLSRQRIDRRRRW